MERGIVREKGREGKEQKREKGGQTDERTARDKKGQGSMYEMTSTVSYGLETLQTGLFTFDIKVIGAILLLVRMIPAVMVMRLIVSRFCLARHGGCSKGHQQSLKAQHNHGMGNARPWL